MTKAILFDLDGTLLDTIADIADSANFALSSLGYPTHATEKYKSFVGNGVDTLVRRILPEESRTPQNLDAVKRVYLVRYGQHSLDTTAPYDGIVDLLDELARAGQKLAVVSNKNDDVAKSTVTYFFGSDRFDYVAGALAGTPLKPDPVAALRAMENMKVSPEECFFVGDTSVDMLTGKNAGLHYGRRHLGLPRARRAGTERRRPHHRRPPRVARPALITKNRRGAPMRPPASPRVSLLVQRSIS